MPDPYRESVDDKAEAAPSAASPTSLSVEQEILALEKELAAKKAGLSKETPRPLEQVIAQETPSPVAAVAPATASVAAPVVPAVPAVHADVKHIKKLEKNQQLKSLVDMAFGKGVSHAVEVVRNLENPYLMDEFHDVLVDELYKTLVEKGKLEEI